MSENKIDKRKNNPGRPKKPEILKKVNKTFSLSVGAVQALEKLAQLNHSTMSDCLASLIFDEHKRLEEQRVKAEKAAARAKRLADKEVAQIPGQMNLEDNLSE